MIWSIISVLIVVIDQLTKNIVVKNIGMGEAVTVINKFFYITRVENTGAAWSIFQGGRYFFIVLTVIVCIGMMYYLYKQDNRFAKLSLSLVIGGAVGNLIDRIAKGSVTDFFEFHFGSYVYPIFNVADMAVVVGTILLAYYMLFIYKEKKD